jgi:hypothetical protein
MHFTGKKPLNMPYYLFIILGKMVDKVQVCKDPEEPSLFHFSLIKLLVLEELRKMKQDWEVFVASSQIEVDSPKYPQRMRDTAS